MKTRRWDYIAAGLWLLILAISPVAATHAQVKVISATPASASQGTISLDVTIDGSGFDSTAQVKFLVSGTTQTGGIVVKKVVVKGSKQLLATIDVAGTAVVANFDIEVSLSTGRKGKGTTLFAVKAALADACIGADSRGFPSLGFNRSGTTQGTTQWAYYLADRNGTCTQSVWSRAYNERYSDVSFRYDAGSRTGIAVGGIGTVQGLGSSQFSVQFDALGKPAVTAAAFNVILTLAQLSARPLPPDPMLTGWQMASMGGAKISPSGESLLITSRNGDGSTVVHWKCALSMPVDLNTCSVVHFAAEVERPRVFWGTTDTKLHVLRSATSGSGSSLYVVDLVNGTSEEIYGRGTTLTAARAIMVQRPDGTEAERVVVHEAGPTSCEQLNIVIDLDTCIDKHCVVINGAGHNGGAGMTWLPDGRVAQNQISRQGSSCSSTGAISAFDPVIDMNGSATTLTTGTDPDGAGGG